MAGARHVIAVDPVEFKRESSFIFGATHTAASMEEATALVGELTWGTMADKVILTMGVAQGEYIQPALAMTAKGGRVVQTAVAPFSVDSVSMNLFELTMYEKQLVGSIFGSANPRRDIPRLLRLYQEGQLKLDELVTQARTRSRRSTRATRPCATAPTSAACSSTTTPNDQPPRGAAADRRGRSDDLRSADRPSGHVAIDASGMLMSASGERVRAVGDRFDVHMDRESLQDYPLGEYTVTVVISRYEPDRAIAWTIDGVMQPPIGHVYGYELEPIDGGTMVTSYYDWSNIHEAYRDAPPPSFRSSPRPTCGRRSASWPASSHPAGAVPAPTPRPRVASTSPTTASDPAAGQSGRRLEGPVRSLARWTGRR